MVSAISAFLMYEGLMYEGCAWATKWPGIYLRCTAKDKTSCGYVKAAGWLQAAEPDDASIALTSF
jgi:hypothetical protein